MKMHPTIKTDNLMGTMKDLMSKMTINEEYEFCTEGRNFLSIRTTFSMLKKNDSTFMKKKFTSFFNEDFSLFTVKRIS